MDPYYYCVVLIMLDDLEKAESLESEITIWSCALVIYLLLDCCASAFTYGKLLRYCRSFILVVILLCHHSLNLLVCLNSESLFLIVELLYQFFKTSGAHCGENGFYLQVKTMISKWKIKTISGDNGFGLWKVKMQTILTQEKRITTLKGETSMHARPT